VILRSAQDDRHVYFCNLNDIESWIKKVVRVILSFRSGTNGGFDAWPTVNAVIRTTWLLVATAIYVFMVFGTS